MIKAQSKIVDLNRLAEAVTAARADNKSVVHCHGVFDLLHIGHMRYFEQAKAMGDVLVVTVTPDRFVDKGPHRPAFTEGLRAEAIASLSCVDYVAVNEWRTAEDTLRLLRPDIYVKGSEFKGITTDMTGKMGLEEKVVREIGGRLAFTEDIVFSSSNLINTYMSLYPQEVQEYLDLFRTRHSLDEVLEIIERMTDLKVLVIGDVIIDEYVYCDALGKSNKDPVLAARYLSEDRFAGGVLAVANHVANFAGKVDLISVVGTKNDHGEFIRERLHPGITSHFIETGDLHTVVKRRYMEGYSLNKLLEIYVMDEVPLEESLRDEVGARVRELASGFDLVVVADFGHGAITRPTVETLCECAPFLAVNTQANAGNRGFHTITQYPRADYICIAEHEMRLEARDARGRLRPMVERVRDQMNARCMVVTRGKEGSVVSTVAGDYIAMPAFARKVVDRVGAGDAYLAITSLAAAQGASPEALGFIGNVVGAEAVEIVGNDKFIDKMKVKKHITSLLK